MTGRYVWQPLPGGGAEQVWVEDVAPAAPAPAGQGAPLTAPLLARLGWIDPSLYAPLMERSCYAHGIRGRLRLAAFLAQTGHESGLGHWRRELWGPTAAQRRYEGRADLGNTQPGDGMRFMGRGLIQITGRTNYEKAALALGVPLDRLPLWLETREGAVTSAAWWWRENGCNELADTGSVEAVTLVVNGGRNGLAHRKTLYAAALAALD